VFTDQFVRELAVSVAQQVISQISAQAGTSVQKRLLSTIEAASYLGLPSASALRQRKAAGQIPEYCWVKLGGSVLYDRQGLDQWISDLKQAA